MKKTILTTVIFCIGLANMNAQTESLSLDAAISAAQTNNVKIKNAKLDELTAKQEVKGVVATGLPQVSATGSFTHNLDIATQLLPAEFLGGTPGTYAPVKFGVDYIGTGAIGVRQLIFDGTFFLGLKAAKQYQEVSRLATEKTENDVKLATAQSYYQILLVDENYTLLSKSLENTNKLYEETKAMFEEGLVEKLDADRLKFGVTQLKAMLTNLENQKKVARQMLNMQMGRDVGTQYILSDNIETVKAKLLTTQENGNLDNLIDYRMLKQQLVLDSLNIKRYQVGRIPTLNFNFNHSQMTQVNDLSEFGQDFYPSTLYSLNINIPLFDGFKRQSDIAKARIAKQKTENNLIELRNGLLLQQNNSRSTYETALVNLKTNEDNMKLAQEIYDVSSIKFKEGVGSSLELTQAQNDLNQAQVDYLNAVYEALVAELEMKQSFGLL